MNPSSAWRRTRRGCLCAGLVWLAAGCAAPPRTIEPVDGSRYWSGRLALNIQAEPAQAVNAGFELTGNAQAGELRIHSPLGQGLARLVWRPGQARLERDNESVSRSSLTDLVQELTGTDLPVTALFDWLAGRDTPVPGWQLDLAQYDSGRITARRLHAPAATLRVVIER